MYCDRAASNILGTLYNIYETTNTVLVVGKNNHGLRCGEQHNLRGGEQNCLSCGEQHLVVGNSIISVV